MGRRLRRRPQGARALRRRHRDDRRRLPGHALSYRWVVLAAGTLAQASYAAMPVGLAVMLPALKADFGLSLTEAGALLAAPAAGSIFSFLLWGLATDRFGERVVASLGLAIAAAALVAAARTDDFGVLIALLVVAGFAGASIAAASGRAVMHWFGPEQRGVALGIRQAANPIGGAVAALTLPAIVGSGGTTDGLTALAIGCLGGAVLAAVLLREGTLEEADEVVGARPLRDPRIWRLSGASFLLLYPQISVLGFTVLFLHEERGLSAGDAARLFAVVQLLGTASRVVVGRWSDAVGSRLGPLRLIAVWSGVLALATGVAVGAPRAVLLPLIVATGVVAMSWNGLSFAATAELAGRARSGASLGLQQTALGVGAATMPPWFAVLAGGLGWGWAWGLTAGGPVLALALLRGLRA